MTSTHADGKNQLRHLWLRQSRLASPTRVAFASVSGVNGGERLAGGFGSVVR
jgi:hypothetical protein